VTMSEPQPELVEAAIAGDAEAITELAYFYDSQPESPEYQLWARKALDVGDFEIGANLILVYEKLGRAQELEELYQLFESSEEHRWAHMLGSVLEWGGFLEKAVHWYLKAIEFGDDDEAAERLWFVHEKLGNEEEAARWRAYFRGEPIPLGEGIGFDERSGEAVIEITDEKTQEALRPLIQESRRKEEVEAERKKEWELYSLKAFAHAGEGWAMDSLADLLKSEDPEIARNWREKAGLAGYPYALLKLGANAKGDGDNDSALRWWSMAHEAGAERGSMNLARMFEDQGDTEKAKEWLVAGAGEGHIPAIDALIALLDRLSNDDEASFWRTKLADFQAEQARAEDQHRKMMEKGVKDGDAEAVCLLGKFHRKHGNSKKARTLFYQAAEMGNADAMNQLGYEANYTDRDLSSAIEWYQRAGEAGLTLGFLNVARIHLEKGDTETAKAWFEKAAKLGSSRAMTDIAEIFFREGDIETCDEWIARAIEATKSDKTQDKT